MTADAEASIAELFARTGVGLCLLDARGSIVRVNARWLEGTAFTPDDARGKNVWEVLPNAPAELRDAHEVARSGRAVVMPCHVHDRSSDRWYQCHLEPFALGDERGLLLTSVDVTESAQRQRQAGAREAEAYAAFEPLLEGCQLIGFDWRYRYVNPALVAQSGMQARAMIGKTVQELYPGVEDSELFRTLSRCMHERVAQRIETEFAHPSGTRGWYDLSIQPHEEGMLILSWDITERKRIETELRRKEQALRAAQHLAHIGNWEIDLRTGERWASDEVHAIYGSTPGGSIERDDMKLERWHPDDRRKVVAALEAIDAGEPVQVRARYYRTADDMRWIVARGETELGPDDVPLRRRGTLQDITDEVRADEALSALRDEHAAVFDASPVPIVALDAQGNVRLWSAAAERVFGFARAEVLKRRLPNVPPELAHEVATTLERGRAGQRTELFTTRVTKAGRPLPVHISTAPLRDASGPFKGLVALIIDLSEQASLRAALAESEQRFAAAFEASPIAKLLVRLADRVVVETNRAYLELTGLSRGAVVGVDVLTLPATPLASDVAWAHADRARGLHLAFEAAGRRREAIAALERIKLAGDDYVLVALEDVTDRVRAETALAESDTRLRQLAETIDEVVWLTEPSKHQVVYISPGYERLWGRSVESLYAQGQDWVDAVHPDDRARVHEAARTRQTTGEYDEEYRIVRPDGTIRWVHDRAYPVKDATGAVVRVAGVAQDVTARRTLEAQLHQSQKLESIGMLAGGIAHDFNNLLTVVMANCEFLSESLPLSGEPREFVHEIREVADRAAGLTRQLLAFSRREVIEPRVVELAQVIIDDEKMLRRLLGEDVRLALELGSAPSTVRVDPGSWMQVFMNLAVNARDAMPRGGALTIRLGHEQITRARPGLAVGDYVTVTVTDTGVGMSEEVMNRVFEPFFTTKSVGHGTGLGLSVVHGIVAQSEGHIELESRPGSGTTFRLWVPTATSEEPPKRVDITRGTRRGRETVLVVEDDERICRAAVRALESGGYEVLCAGDGDEALVVASAAARPIDMLVTDIVMPRMDGRTLAEALVARDRSLRVLYTSGFTDDAIVRYGVQRADVAFLRKPYTPDALRSKVREVLDGG